MTQCLARLISLLSLLCVFQAGATNETIQWEEAYANAVKSDGSRALSLLNDRYTALKPGIEKLYVSSKLHGFMMLHKQPYYGKKTIANEDFTTLEKLFISALNSEEQLDFTSAVNGYLSLLQYAEQQNSIDGKILFEYHLCRVFNRQAQYYQADVYCTSLNAHIKHVSSSILPKHMALRVIANNQEFLGNYQAALVTYQSLLADIPPYFDSSGVYNDAGLLLSTLGHFNKAKEYILTALKMRRQNKSQLRLAQSHHSMGKITLKNSNYETAIMHFLQSKLIVEQYNHLIGLTYAQLGLGQAYIGLGRFEQGTRYLLNALDSATKQDNPQIRGEIYLTLALAHKEQRKYFASRKFAQQALSLAESIGSKRLQNQVLKLLAEIAEEQHDFSLALVYYRAYAKSELNKRDSEHRSAFVALDVQKRDYVNQMQLTNLTQENESLRSKIQSLESKNHLLLFIIVLLVLGFAGYVQYRRTKVAQSELDMLTMTLNRATAIREIKSKVMLTNTDLRHVLLLIRLDNFHHINDSYGHPTGVRALRHVADVIKKQKNASDIVGRLGDDEFVVLFTEVDELDVTEKVALLHQAIGKTMFKSECRQSLNATASVSNLATSKALNDFDELYLILHQALDQIKHNEKNCIIDAYNEPIDLSMSAYVSVQP